MKALTVFRPLTGLVVLLMIVQLACGMGSPAPTQAATAASGGSQGLAQETQPAPTSAGEHASPSDAQAMLKAAAQDYETNGREQALKHFNDRKPPFANRDLYVVCLGEDHKVTALGEFPLLVGTSADSLKDPNGTPIGELVWQAATLQPEGQVPFHWNNPLTGLEESKILFYQKLSQDVCGVAADQP